MTPRMSRNMAIPPSSSTATAAKSLPDQLRDGDIDAAILGNDQPKGDGFAPVTRDHRVVDETWVTNHGYMPINHMVAVGHAAFDGQPDAVRPPYMLLRRAAAEAKRQPGPPDVTLFGIDAPREPLASASSIRRPGMRWRLLSVAPRGSSA